MTFKEFRNSESFNVIAWWILTLDTGEVEVLQWEPSNQKWYKPRPEWGRQEHGYLNIVGANGTILSMSPVFSNPNTVTQ